jgi:2-keto-4-pentenoate hydratase/2-oxohepta-3-ene-1,7-dioic acid hydratase in catechol pathway
MSDSYLLKIADGGPTVAAQNIYCIGRNYAEHARELGNEIPSEPVVFLKSTAALRALSAGPLAFAASTFHHEAEVVVLIGRRIELGATAGWEAVRGLGLGLDVTRRDIQNNLKAKGLPWTTAKSFAGSAPVSEFIPLERFPSRDAILFSFSINGTLRQHGDTSLMLHPIPSLLTHLAKLGPLVPGDLIFTGTPAGVGPLRQGDEFELSFDQLPRRFSGRL